MKASSLFSMVLVASITALGLSACVAEPGANRACVIFPDADAGTRWEASDRPAFEQGLSEAGYEVDIQNAESDSSKYATIAEAQLAQGCGVMVLVDFQGAGVAAAEKAADAGVPVIAYDRPIAGADYYVSFDNFTAGVLQGQMILDGLEAAGKDATTASIIYSSGDPTDGYATLLLDGARSVLDPAGATASFTIDGTWDSAKAGTLFEQALTTLDGEVDAVLAPNDSNAAAIIAILDSNGLVVPVSGQGASIAGLQNVLLGKQTGTVYKPFQLEVDATVAAIVALLRGETIDTAKQLDDGTAYIAVDPVSVGAGNVRDVVADGFVSATAVCTGAAAAACEQFGVK